LRAAAERIRAAPPRARRRVRRGARGRMAGHRRGLAVSASTPEGDLPAVAAGAPPAPVDPPASVEPGPAPAFASHGVVPRTTLLAVGLRATLLRAAWNFERQQGLGWAFAMMPALARLYPDRATRLERLAEHTAYFNTQPTLASLTLGAAIRAEEQRAAGVGDAAGMARLKSPLGSTLAAVGDRLVWFSLGPFAAAVGVLLALAHPERAWGALSLWIYYAVPHLGLRFGGVLWGYEAGPGALTGAFRERLERTVRILAVLGCA